MKERIKKLIRRINILNDDREIRGNFILWSFIKLFSTLSRLSQGAAALTYHTLFAVVPVMALLVATAKQLGYAELFKEKVAELFFGADGVSRSLLSMTESYLGTADTTHWVGAIAGLFLLLYSVFSIYMTIDESINMLWNLKGHSIKKLLKVFLLVLLIPFVTVMLLVMSISLSSYLGEGVFKDVNIFVLTIALMIGALFLLYKFVPCAEVNTRYAFLTAVACGSVLGLLQYYGYIIFGAFTRMQDIYGGLAGIFLFLLWINVSWYICLAGARWIYLLQEGKRLDMENRFKSLCHNSRRSLLVRLVREIQTVAEGRPDGTFKESELLAVMNREYNQPPSVTSHLINEMQHKGILVEDAEERLSLCEGFAGHAPEELAVLLDNAGLKSLEEPEFGNTAMKV